MPTICRENTGYLNAGYAMSLAECGVPRALRHSGGWILERAIPGWPYQDAMGCYPLFSCLDWSQLDTDLREVGRDLISLSLVTDPFGEYSVHHLKQCFRDIVIPFKEHFCVDLGRPMDSYVSGHHRRYARKALEQLQVARCPDGEEWVDDWVELYCHLVQRHGITGIAAFSRTAFIEQCRVPGLVAFRATYRGVPVGMLLWYVQGNVIYYHLGAYNPTGYDLRASFALFWFAIEYFGARGYTWLALGAGAGLRADGADGLSRFKRGWSTGTRTAYFCGRIFNQKAYADLVEAKGTTGTSYFPAYRSGEWH